MDNNQDYWRDPIWQSAGTMISVILLYAMTIIGIYFISKPNSSFLTQMSYYTVATFIILISAIIFIFLQRKSRIKIITCGVLNEILVISTNPNTSRRTRDNLLINYMKEGEEDVIIKKLHMLIIKIVNINNLTIKEEDYYKSDTKEKEFILIEVGARILDVTRQDKSSDRTKEPKFELDSEKKKILFSAALRGKEWVTLKVLVDDFDSKNFHVEGPTNEAIKVNPVTYASNLDEKISQFEQRVMLVCCLLSIFLLLSALFLHLNIYLIFSAFLILTVICFSFLLYSAYKWFEKRISVTSHQK